MTSLSDLAFTQEMLDRRISSFFDVNEQMPSCDISYIVGYWYHASPEEHCKQTNWDREIIMEFFWQGWEDGKGDKS